MTTAMGRPLGTHPEKRRENDDFFEDVLDTFSEDFEDRDITPEALDSIYSRAIAEGLVTDGECEEVSERILERIQNKKPTEASQGGLSFCGAAGVGLPHATERAAGLKSVPPEGVEGGAVSDPPHAQAKDGSGRASRSPPGK